jgi:hypothetical protein
LPHFQLPQDLTADIVLVMTVELRPPAGANDLFEAWADGIKIGLVRLAVTDPVAKMAVQLETGPLLVEDVSDLVVAMVKQAKEDGATDAEFCGESLLLRHVARQLGFRGGLRVPLEAKVDNVAAPVLFNDRAQTIDRHERVEWLIAALHDVGVDALAARPNLAFGRLMKRLVGGVGDTLEVIIEWAPGRSFIVSMPDRWDLMPEAIALAGDMTTSVLNRFPDQAFAVKFVYFDRATYGMKAGRHAGVTEGSAPSVHLNVGFVAIEESLTMMSKRADNAGRSTSARPPSPFFAVDGTVAHELWHKIESVFEAHHYKSSIAFRRQLGLHLGVETLEHAIKGGSKNAPTPWKTAHRRLIDEVSSYAATSPREATAEMFKLWWCRNGAATPMVARFGELIDEFLPR